MITSSMMMTMIMNDPQCLAYLTAIGRICAKNNQGVSWMMMMPMLTVNQQTAAGLTKLEEAHDLFGNELEDHIMDDEEEEDQEEIMLDALPSGFTPSKLFSIHLANVLVPRPYTTGHHSSHYYRPHQDSSCREEDPRITKAEDRPRVSFCNKALLLHPNMDRLLRILSSNTTDNDDNDTHHHPEGAMLLLRSMYHMALSVLEYHYALSSSLLAMAIAKSNENKNGNNSSNDSEAEQQSYWTVASESYRQAEDLFDQIYGPFHEDCHRDAFWMVFKLALCNNQVHVFAQPFFFDTMAIGMNGDRMKLPLEAARIHYPQKYHRSALFIKIFRQTHSWAQEQDAAEGDMMMMMIDTKDPQDNVSFSDDDEEK